MSDSESEHSNNVDTLDQLIQAEKEKNEKGSVTIKEENVDKVKEEPTDDNVQQTNQSDDSDQDEKPPKLNVDVDEKPSKSKLQMHQQRNIQKVRERQLREQVFGDKNKLLHNLQITAEGGAKKRKKATPRKRPVWDDSDDEGYDLVTKIDNRKRSQVLTDKKAYKKQLENKFQRLLGTPAWAQLDAERAAGADDDSDDDVLRSVGHLATVKSERLPSGQLKFKQLKDLNRETYEEGPLITGIEFHPTSTVCLVAGTRGIATIFSIDGKQNDKLHSMAFENYPIRCCRLNNAGTEAIFGGSHKYFYTYDLIGGQTQRVFLPKTITKMHKFEVSPCGKYIAVIGRFGEIHLLYGSSKELICTMKQEHEATSLAFSRDSRLLFAHSVDSEVCVYDIGEQRLIHRFIDDGCINGTSISISLDGKLVAAASKQGVVNVYNYNDVISKKTPTPEKTILNLTTAISNIKFNHSSEMLAFASNEVNDAVKITHIHSGTVFNNFPGNLSKIGKPQVVQFSPQSGFMAIGNNGKEVLLYRLKHFNNY